MTAWERVFHAVLFELLAIIFTVILTSLTTSHSTSALSGVIVLISLIAMAWNVVFNWIFDQFFTGKREERGFGVRLFHTLTFEGGLLLFTVPLIVFVLEISWWEAFVMDMGMTLFILVYTMIFNWAYDNVRAKLKP